MRVSRKPINAPSVRKEHKSCGYTCWGAEQEVQVKTLGCRIVLVDSAGFMAFWLVMRRGCSVVDGAHDHSID